jgi:hypothetical protein
MEPDSLETRRILEPLGRSLAFEREWIMKGGAIADVAGW